MTQDDYLARIDQRLESLVNQIERMLQYIYADSTSTKAAVFGLGDYLQESNDRMARIESASNVKPRSLNSKPKQQKTRRTRRKLKPKIFD